MTSSIPTFQTLTTVENFRDLVHEHFSKFIDQGEEYDDRDIERFDDNDKYTLMFIRHGQYGTTFNKKKALPYFHESMSWRKKNKVNEISKNEFSADYIQRHGIYFKNHDINNNSIFYCAFRTMMKEHEDRQTIEKLIIYKLEEHLRSHLGQPIVMLFDMTGTGLKHLDYELAKFILSVTYISYPGLIVYVLVYELPVILSTAWEIIRSWLSTEAQETVKFVDKKSITQFIQFDQLPIAIYVNCIKRDLHNKHVQTKGNEI